MSNNQWMPPENQWQQQQKNTQYMHNQYQPQPPVQNQYVPPTSGGMAKLVRPTEIVLIVLLTLDVVLRLYFELRYGY